MSERLEIFPESPFKFPIGLDSAKDALERRKSYSWGERPLQERNFVELTLGHAQESAN